MHQKNIQRWVNFLPVSLFCAFSMSCWLVFIQATFESQQHKKPTNAKELVKWKNERKGHDYDPGKLLAAKKIVQKMVLAQEKESIQRDGGLKAWSWKGPGNIGGRVRAIALRDNGSGGEEIFIGAAGGGIWRSANGGATWTAMNDFLPSLAVTDIKVDPANNQIMYAATGEGFGNSDAHRGAGIFKSTDAGLSWTQLASTDNHLFRYTNRIAIRTDTSSIIFAVTSQGVFKTVDRGGSWTKIFDPASSPLDIRMNPNDQQHILVGCRDDVYQSYNGGKSFSQENGVGAGKIFASPDRVEVAFAPSNENVAYCTIEHMKGQIWKTINKGVTWQLMHTGSEYMDEQGWYDNAIWVDPLNENRIIVGGIDIWRSMNGGTNLDRISNWRDYHNTSAANSAHADNHICIPSLSYSASNPKVYVGNDGGIQMAGNIWTVGTGGWTNLCSSTLGITQFFGGSAASDGSVYIGGAQDNSFSLGSSTGNWTQPMTGDGAYAVINPDDPDIMYANVNYNAIYKSIDGGSSWDWIASFNDDYAGFCTGYGGCNVLIGFVVDDDAPLIGHFILDPTNDNNLFVGARRLWKNISGGGVGDWSYLTDTMSGVGHIGAIDVRNNSNDIWIGYSHGRIQRSTDGGSTWSGDLGIDSIPNSSVTDIAIDPDNFNRVAITVGGYHTRNIWLTEDGGATWSNRSLPFGLQVNSIRFHPDATGWLYIGTDIGAFASEDFGLSWSVRPIYGTAGSPGGNDGPVYVEIGELSWQGDGSSQNPYYLVAATHGRGIWVTSGPVLEKIYVDKEYAGLENGSFSKPFNTLKEALLLAGDGSTVVFKSQGTHNELPGAMIIDSKVGLELYITSNGVIIE